MRSKAFRVSLVMLALVVLAPLVVAQDPDQEDVRGAFLTTRPKAAERPANTSKPTHHRPRTGTGKTSTGDTDTKVTDTKGTGSGATVPVGSSRTPDTRLGLGMTLFMQDANGLAVRVDPNREFSKGDRVRVLLETNADGHLYIFNTTDGGEPVMVYPDPQLDEGGNYINAHVPFEIPSSLADEDRLRWFTFDEHGGTERLIFVFTREPLNGVPIEDELMKVCGEKKNQCAWKPTPQLWSSLQKEMDAPSRSNNSHKFGKAQTEPERQATTRGIGLAKEDAEPSMVVMTASSGPSLLVTALQLSHK